MVSSFHLCYLHCCAQCYVILLLYELYLTDITLRHMASETKNFIECSIGICVRSSKLSGFYVYRNKCTNTVAFRTGTTSTKTAILRVFCKQVIFVKF